MAGFSSSPNDTTVVYTSSTSIKNETIDSSTTMNYYTVGYKEYTYYSATYSSTPYVVRNQYTFNEMVNSTQSVTVPIENVYDLTYDFAGVTTSLTGLSTTGSMAAPTFLSTGNTVSLSAASTTPPYVFMSMTT